MSKLFMCDKLRASLSAACLTTALIAPQWCPAEAQMLSHSEQYQDLFMNAGYSALFGAALGTAALPFIPGNSVSNLRVIAGGASIGFVAGSIMALYNMRQNQNYGMQYYPDVAPNAGEGPHWNWDVGSSNGKDLFVKMDSHF